MTMAHFALSNGVARSAIAIANILAGKPNVEITLIPIFRIQHEAVDYLDPKVKVKKVFGFYFHGFAKLLKLLPPKVLYKLVVKDKYDIEIAFQYEIPTIAIAGSTNKSAKHFCWMHSYDDNLTIRESYLKMDKMVCVSKANALRLSQELKSNIPIDYCYNPIDDKFVRQQGNEMIELEKNKNVQFVTVGRLHHQKGYSMLLKCCHRLIKDGYDFSLWIVGDGELMDELSKESSKLSLGNVVTFTGKQNNPHKFTSKADIFVCSSIWEGYSTACTEAIMLGVPVITTDVSGGKEIIEESECGIVTEINEDSLYLGMKKILDNPTLIVNWKKTLGRTRVKFSQEVREQQLFNILGIK